MKAEKVPSRRRGKPSHREDLAQELLEAGRRFVEENGHEALSMRKLADAIGVSSAAPYHHFADRRALLVALALDGYREMFELSREEMHGGGARGHLKGLLHDFIRFASDNPRIFSLMYESELVRGTLDPAIQEVQDRGFRGLHEAVARIVPHLSDRERSVRLSTIWCAVFGYALQLNHQMIRTPQPEPKAEELETEIIDQALRLLDD